MWKFIKKLFKREKRKIYERPKDVQAKPIFLDGMLLDIEIHGMSGFTEAEKEFFLEAMRLKLIVINSSEFYDQIMKTPVSETNGMSRQEAYDLLMSGVDVENKQADGDIDIFINMFYKNNNTIGLTYMNTYKTYMNRKYFKKYMEMEHGAAMLAGHVLHEALHNLGFKHRYRKSKSLVYKWGNICKVLARQVMNGRKLDVMTIDRDEQPQ